MIKFAAIVLLLLPFQTHAETLCGNSKNDEYSIKEQDYNMESALRSIETIKEILRETVALNAFERRIAILNHIAIIKGTILKQNVLVLQVKSLESGTKTDKLNYDNALRKFCELTSNAKYID